MNEEISLELFKGEILDKYVKKFLISMEFREKKEVLEFSGTLIRGVETILFNLDFNKQEPIVLLSDLKFLLDEFVKNILLNFPAFGRKSESDNIEKLSKKLSAIISDEKQWVINNKSSNKVASDIRKCILKILNAIIDFQNSQFTDKDNLIEILNREYQRNEGNKKNQVFLSHAYIDRVYTLGLFLYFYDKDIYLYIDWMHQTKGLTRKIKNNLLSAINNSAQLLFLRTLNSELGLQGGSRQIREWCAWEIGTFDYKSKNPSGEGFYIDRYRQNRQVKSRSQLIQDYQPLRRIKNGRLY